MKQKKIAATCAACVLMLSILSTGCGKQDAETTQAQAPAQTQAPVQTTEAKAPVQTQENLQNTSAETENTVPESTAPTPTGAEPVLLNTLDFSNCSVYSHGKSGLIYKNADGKFGYISGDASADTGAIYAALDNRNSYLICTSDDSELTEELSSLNRFGALSLDGRAVVPEEYATLESAGGDGRYVIATKVTEKTANKDEALVYIKSSTFSVAPADGDPMYKGEWVVFDTQTGNQVPGVTGTSSPSVYIYGDFIRYTAADGTKHTVDASGTELRSDAVLYDNGTYVVQEPSVATVYRADGSVLFTYDPNDFNVVYKSSSGSGYFAEKTVNGAKAYALLDENGTVISADFSSVDGAVGNFAISDSYGTHTLYALDGTTLLTSDAYIRVHEDTVCGRSYVVSGKSGEHYRYLFFDAAGTLLLDVTEDDAHSVNEYSTSPYAYLKKDDGNRYYYNFKDGDYTIQTSGDVDYWMIGVENSGGKKDLIDTFTGETVLRGYDKFYSFVKDSKITVFAFRENTKSFDVFQLS